MNHGASERSSGGKDVRYKERAQQLSLLKATEMTPWGREAGQTLVGQVLRAGSREEPHARGTEAARFQCQWKSAMCTASPSPGWLLFCLLRKGHGKIPAMRSVAGMGRREALPPATREVMS